MPTYKTPGVYVEEISTLPPSVAEVSTAVPAFFGCTERGPDKSPPVARVDTMLDFKELFGGAPLDSFTAAIDPNSNLKSVPSIERTVPAFDYLLYHAVNHFFKNGGGSCYIVNVGDYTAAPAAAAFGDDVGGGLWLLEKEDEPTLIVLTDAVNLAAADYYSLCQQALAQCHKLGDRFAIFDVPGGDVADFRDGVGINHLAYGAAYHPYLLTKLTARTTDANVTVVDGTESPPAIDTLDKLAAESDLYQKVWGALANQRLVLPPSAAIAGVYASVDRDRGVWKAPANVSLAEVIGPVEKITHDDQEGLNVDPTSGKSVNAIRAFTGRGTLVWGARTLAGNDNEWRYVSVRRLFNMIEESARNSTAFAVFEPNDARTWLKVRGMVESYLFGLWERGAFAGTTPEEAYFVNVGLGKTMTQQDVLEGRMIVEIGAAAVRPAEFIVLRFTHKLQEA